MDQRDGRALRSRGRSRSSRERRRWWVPAALPGLLLAGLALAAPPASADGLLENITGNDEVFVNLLNVTSKDKTTGTTTNSDIFEIGSRTNAALNFNLLPTLNVNSGVTYERDFTKVTGDTDTETTLSRLRPFFWLTFRDPILNGSFGYDYLDDRVKTKGLDETSVIRESYNVNLNWRPVDLPFSNFRYTRTNIHDGTRDLIDTTEDNFYLKTEYLYRGLDVYYAGTYIDTRDKVRDSESKQTTHEGRLLYASTFFDRRVVRSTDHRYRWTELELDNGVPFTGLGTTIGFALPATAGLSSIDATPITDPLAGNPSLIDGDVATSAGINIGFTGEPTTNLRNVGLDFGSPLAVNRIQIAISGFSGTLPGDIATFYVWQVWTSTNNLNWTLQATVAPAVFSTLDRRFSIAFLPQTARYIKVTVQPLPGTVIGTTNTSLFPTIFITEMQAFNDSTSTVATAGSHLRLTQTLRSHNLDVNVFLLRRAADQVYYRFYGGYQELDAQDTTTRYIVSNGLYYTHRFNDILTGNANGTYEFGREGPSDRQAVLYYASLAATPLPTLTDTLVFSGRREWIQPNGSSSTRTAAATPETTLTANSVVLYNTAQLYRGIDLTLNLGANFTTEDPQGGTSIDRRETYVNLGLTLSPHPALTQTTYYTGKLTHTTTDGAARDSRGASGDVTEHTLDLGLSFNPFRTLTLSAQANIKSQTDQSTTVNQNYSVNWSPFPDGLLQLTMFYSQSQFSDNSVTARIVQPTVRLYLSPRRRSYFEAGYQLNTSDSKTQKTEAQGVGARLNIFY